MIWRAAYLGQHFSLLHHFASVTHTVEHAVSGIQNIITRIVIWANVTIVRRSLLYFIEQVI